MIRGFVLLLVLLVSIACTLEVPPATPTPAPAATPTPAPAATPTPAPAATPIPWTTFQQSDHVFRSCLTDSDYLISIPPTWVVAEVLCDEVVLESRDEHANANVTLVDLPNYNSNMQVALEELAEDYRENYSFQDFLGHNTTVTVVNLQLVEYNGRDAILRTLEATHELQFLYCTTRAIELIVPNAGWGVIEKTRWAYKVVVSECKSGNRHRYDFPEIIESFRQL